MAEAPSRSSIRLDADTRAALTKYMQGTGMTFSQAMRVLLALALREESQSADIVVRSAAFKEGVRAGIAALSSRTHEIVQTVMQDFKEYL